MVDYFCLAPVINSLHSVIHFKDMFYGVAFGNEKVVVLHETRWKSDAVLMIMAFEMAHIQEHPHSKLGPLHHSLSCTITLGKHCVTLLSIIITGLIVSELLFWASSSLGGRMPRHALPGCPSHSQGSRYHWLTLLVVSGNFQVRS